MSTPSSSSVLGKRQNPSENTIRSTASRTSSSSNKRMRREEAYPYIDFPISSESIPRIYRGVVTQEGFRTVQHSFSRSSNGSSSSRSFTNSEPSFLSGSVHSVSRSLLSPSSSSSLSFPSGQLPPVSELSILWRNHDWHWKLWNANKLLQKNTPGDEARAIQSYIQLIDEQAEFPNRHENTYLEPFKALIALYQSKNSPRADALLIGVYDLLILFSSADKGIKADACLQKGILFEKSTQSNSFENAVASYKAGLCWLEPHDVNSKDPCYKQLCLKLAYKLFERNNSTSEDFMDSMRYFIKYVTASELENEFPDKQTIAYLVKLLQLQQSKVEILEDSLSAFIELRRIETQTDSVESH